MITTRAVPALLPAHHRRVAGPHICRFRQRWFARLQLGGVPDPGRTLGAPGGTHEARLRGKRDLDADSRWEKPMATGRQDPPTEAAQDGLFTVAGVAARTDQVLARSRELRARSRPLLAHDRGRQVADSQRRAQEAI